MNIKTRVVRELPKKNIERFVDRTVYNIARITLENTEPHIPVLSKHLYDDFFARGVKGGNARYTLGTTDTEYTMFVWNMPKGTHWTNKQTYPQWFITEWNNNKEKIVDQAINQAKAVMK